MLLMFSDFIDSVFGSRQFVFRRPAFNLSYFFRLLIYFILSLISFFIQHFSIYLHTLSLSLYRHTKVLTFLLLFSHSFTDSFSIINHSLSFIPSNQSDSFNSSLFTYSFSLFLYLLLNEGSFLSRLA